MGEKTAQKRERGEGEEREGEEREGREREREGRERERRRRREREIDLLLLRIVCYTSCNTKWVACHPLPTSKNGKEGNYVLIN